MGGCFGKLLLHEDFGLSTQGVPSAVLCQKRMIQTECLQSSKDLTSVKTEQKLVKLC